MPNWCETFIQVFSNGTPEGMAALQDFHKKLQSAKRKVNETVKWQRENFIFQKCGLDNHSLLWEDFVSNEYGIKIDNTSCRGYICYFTDISIDNFCIDCCDAWGPNIGFWNTLIQYAYGDKLCFTYKAEEPGMHIYVTNDWGLLPRYSFNMYLEDVNDILKMPNLWNWDNPLFPYLNRKDPCVDTLYGIPSVEATFEGDDDELIEFYAEEFDNDCENIDYIRQKAQDINSSKFGFMSVDEYEYSDYCGEDGNIIQLNKNFKGDKDE